MSILIPDIFNHILCLLPLSDVFKVMQVCQQLRSITENSWSQLCKKKYGCTQLINPKLEYLRRSCGELGRCSVCHANEIYYGTPERGIGLCFACYCKEAISAQRVQEKYKLSPEDLTTVLCWHCESLGNAVYYLKSDVKAYLESKGQPKKVSWRKELFELLQVAMDFHKAKHLAMHAMPADRTTVAELANYYIENVRAHEESERMDQLRQALNAVNISMEEIPAIYSPHVQAYIHGKKSGYTMNELVALVGASKKHKYVLTNADVIALNGSFCSAIPLFFVHKKFH